MPPPAQPARRLFVVMIVLVALTVFIGFAPTYFLRVVLHRDAQPLRLVLHLHGMAFSAWIILLAVQIALVRNRRVGLHRQLGVFGGFLAALMIVLAFMAALSGARRDLAGQGGVEPLKFLAIVFGDLLMFATLVGMALLYRRQPDTHKRLMLLATIVLLPAALARFPFAAAGRPIWFFGAADLLVVGCCLYERMTRGRVHPAFLYGGLLVIATQPLRFVIGATDAWIAFARWLL